MELSGDVFKAVVSSIDEAVVITDTTLDKPGPRILYVNSAFERMTGYSHKEVKGKSLRLLEGRETDRAVIDRLTRNLEAGELFHGQTTNYRKDGTPFEIEWRVSPIRTASGEVLYYMSIQQDITSARARQNWSRQLMLLQKVSQEVAAGGLNLDLVRRKIADTAMEATNAEAAVVEEAEGDEMVYRAVAGTAAGSLGLRLPVDRSMSGMCYTSRTVLTCNDAETDPRVRLKEKARTIGFRSALLVPLVHKQRGYGVLKVYSREPGAFTDGDRQLLQLASDILAAQLFYAAAFDEELRKRQLFLDATPMLIAYLDREQRYVEINAAHEKFFNRSLSDIRGKPLWEVVSQETYDQLRPYVEAALGGESVSFDVDLRPRGEKERSFRGYLEPHYQSNGQIAGCYAAIQDITDAKRADEDYLTGLSNRRYFERIGKFIMRARKRNGMVVSLLMLDVDRFKEVNDRYGHLRGDEVLKELATIISESTRQADVACRWGGEEFAILLNGTGRAEAVSFVERLTEQIREHSFGEVGSVTVSGGFTEAQPNDTLESLQRRADAALYQAKEGGRDQVVGPD